MSAAIVHQSLVTPIMIMGLPRAVFWTNVLLCMDMVLLGAWWLLGLSLIIHFYAALICKSDPEIFTILVKYFTDNEDYLEG